MAPALLPILRHEHVVVGPSHAPCGVHRLDPLIDPDSPGHGGDRVLVPFAGWKVQPQVLPFALDHIHMPVLHVL